MYPNQNYPNYNRVQPYFNRGMTPNTMNPLSAYPRNRMYQKPLTRAFANFNYYNFLEGTQKTLTTVNQIIPIVNQVSPMVRNVAMIFKVANVMNTIPNIPDQPQSTNSTTPSTFQNNIENPTLF